MVWLNEVLGKYDRERQVTGSSAAEHLKSILPTKITTDSGLTANVMKVDLRSVKASGLKPADIQNYLTKHTLV